MQSQVMVVHLDVVGEKSVWGLYCDNCGEEIGMTTETIIQDITNHVCEGVNV